MQQIKNALSMLSVVPEARPAGVGPAAPGSSTGQSEKSPSEQGFGRVLQDQVSAPASKPEQPAEAPAEAVRKDAEAKGEGVAEERRGGQPEASGKDSATTESEQSGKIMPPGKAELPLPEVADAGQGKNPVAEIASASVDETVEIFVGERGRSQTRGIHPLTGRAAPGQSEKTPGEGVALEVQTLRDEQARLVRAAHGVGTDVDPETVREPADARQGAQSARNVDVAENRAIGGAERPERGEQLAAQRGVRDASEVSVNRAAANGSSEAPAARQAAAVTVVAPAAETAGSSSSRGVVVMQNGMEPPFGARIAAGQEGWNQLVAQRIANLAVRGSTGAEIQLDPPELGPIKVTIQMVGEQQASVTVQSHSQAVRDALEQSAHRLRDLFQQSGLDLSNLDVSDQGWSRGQGEESSGEPEGGLRVASAAVDEAHDAVDETPVATVIEVDPNRIDFYI